MNKKIFIDPGHGGPFHGATNSGVMEKDITLQIGLEVYINLLRRPGYQVMMSRMSDTNLSDNLTEDLKKRCERANHWGGDVYVSIHCNSFHDPTVQGVETFYYGISHLGEELASYIYKELVIVFPTKGRGVKSNSKFRVLKSTQMPATLLELNFLSNPVIQKLLVSRKVQRIIADRICHGLDMYFLKTTQRRLDNAKEEE